MRSAAGDPKLPVTPPTTGARVVFFRISEQHNLQLPSRHRHDPTPVHVVDENAELLGDLEPDSWFAIDLAPGDHQFFAWHDQTVNAHEVSALRATLLAKHVYYVVLMRSAKDGFFSRAPLELSRSAPPLDETEWPSLHAMVTDRADAHLWSTIESEAVHARIQEGENLIAHKQFNVVRASDGFTSLNDE